MASPLMETFVRIQNGSVQLLAGLAIILGIPFPVWIYYKGEAIRLRSKVNL